MTMTHMGYRTLDGQMRSRISGCEQERRRALVMDKPQIFFHAAYEHVPLMEEDDNAWACLRKNMLRTHNSCCAAAAHGAERLMLISTDDAVNRTNVIGAIKRAAELIISHMASQDYQTKFMVVRFGNVLCSSGSEIPSPYAMIRMLGLNAPKIAITFTGLRAGEKLSDKLIAGKDTIVPTAIDRLWIAELGATPFGQELAYFLNL